MDVGVRRLGVATGLAVLVAAAATLAPPTAGAVDERDLPLKECQVGVTNLNNPTTSVKGLMVGDRAQVTVTNINVLGVVGSVNYGDKTLGFTLLPTGSQTYELPPPAQLITTLPRPAGFDLDIKSDSYVVKYVVKSTMCADDEYLQYYSVVGGSAPEPPDGRATATVQLQMGRKILRPETLHVVTRDGDATAGRDYLPVDTTVTIQPGQQFATVPVPVLSDHSAEAPESLFVDVTGDPPVVNLPVTIPVKITDTAPARPDTLSAGQRLTAGDEIVSANGQVRAVMQDDGNFVLYGPGGTIWASGTTTPGSSVTTQDDGNVVLADPSGNVSWSTSTPSGPAYLVVQDDQNLVLYSDSDRRVLWSSNTPLPR